MGTTLGDMRTRLRKRLDDDGAVVWTDAELQEHIEAALRDLSPSIPNQLATAVATTPADRDVSLTTLTRLIRTVAIEFPTGQFPRNFQPFSVWGPVLTLIGDAVGDGSNCTIYYESTHSIDAIGGTLPVAHDEILLLGAAWLACEQQAADATNSINDAGTTAAADWARRAGNFRSRYEKRKNRAQPVRVSSTSAASQPFKRQQSTDPGP